MRATLKDMMANMNQEVVEGEVNYIPIKEINLDDNGLKDGSFA